MFTTKLHISKNMLTAIRDDGICVQRRWAPIWSRKIEKDLREEVAFTVEFERYVELRRATRCVQKH